MDKVEVPTHEWFLSPAQSEIYQYELGNFKAFPAAESLWSFHPHHTLKVLPKDVVLVRVGYSREYDRYLVLEVLPRPQSSWKTITKASDVEELLITRNKRHLQQICVEGGSSAEPPMSDFLGDKGLGRHSRKLLNGEYSTI